MDKAKNHGSALTDGERSFVEGMLALPHKIVQHHHIDGLAQLVLYDISNTSRFGLKKAAYLVDNPDFDCLHGIAGFHDGEFDFSGKNLWSDPSKYASEIGNMTFNKNVRGFRSSSLSRKKIDFSDQSQVVDLAVDLGIERPSTMGWQQKHGNHGVFIYEPREDVCIWRKSILASVVALLGLCAI